MTSFNVINFSATCFGFPCINGDYLHIQNFWHSRLAKYLHVFWNRVNNFKIPYYPQWTITCFGISDLSRSYSCLVCCFAYVHSQQNSSNTYVFSKLSLSYVFLECEYSSSMCDTSSSLFSVWSHFDRNKKHISQLKPIQHFASARSASS